MNKKIRIILADDHPLVRYGLHERLAKTDNIDVVDVAENGKELIQKVDALRPDVVLTDISMPEMGGMEAATWILEHYPDIKILILTMHTNQDYIQRLMDAGVMGYVSKNVSSAEVISAIRQVYEGEKVIKAEPPEVHASVPEVLTKRESEVLRLLIMGLTNKSIARNLGIGCRTVESHRENIYSKLDTRAMTGLVKYAIDHNLIAF